VDPFEKLQSLRGQSVELGLWQITRLLDRLDHPERDFPAIHVAGTNGKGSVCAMAAAALRRAGHRVGLLTSPHLVDFPERIRVDGRPIPRDAAGEILEILDRPEGDGPFGSFDGSFFEVTTALAFEHFRREGVDVAVLEVGLGGRLDASNVCFPAVTAITSIDLDHVKTLGPDLASIAAEKAGIVKPGIPVVLGPLEDEPRAVIEATAARRGAPVYEAAGVRVLSSGWDGLEVAVSLAGERERYARVGLPGRHQAANLGVAAAAVRLFDPRDHAVEALLEGLEDTHWPGRLTRVEGNPVRVYDVAHNAAGARALDAALGELGVPEGSVLVIGVLSDKEVDSMAATLARHFRLAVTATPPHPLRARPAEETAEAFRAAGVEALAVEDVADACREAAGRIGSGGWVFVTGSLFTVGAALEAFGDAHLAARPGGGNPAHRRG
jgi:dihydrofolate synthase / folylpolyglutamate synthase